MAYDALGVKWDGYGYISNKDLGVNGDEYGDEYRADPRFVKVVEELGDDACGEYAKLVVVEIPDDIEWEIDEYDGYETIREAHRSW
jgi:hypothetical protein